VNGIHDMGGMHGFGPVVRERDESVFHAEWERRTFAMMLAMMGRRAFNADEFRRTIERIPAVRYLAASYYERWSLALENILIEKGVVARREIDVVMAAVRAGASPPQAPVNKSGEKNSPAASSEQGSAALSEALGGGARSLRCDKSYRPRFKTGDRVIARNMNPEGHTRMPRYVRGHRGVIHRDWGVFVFPDTHAHGEGTKPQHCYAVEFEARELWGGDYPAGERVYVDLWEDYLDGQVEAAVDARPLTNGSRKPVAKTAAKPHPKKPARIRVANAKRTAPKARDTRPPSVKE
jgi:nitrile hydratase beta subunit